LDAKLKCNNNSLVTSR